MRANDIFSRAATTGLVLAASLAPLTARAEIADEAPVTVRRFALIVGANNGGRQRVLLRYAASDARALADVLESLGGVDPVDRMMLLDPTRQAFEASFLRMAGKLRPVSGGRERAELIFYYSGHSDETGLLLREDRVTYKELRELLDGLPADVRIAILDSCSSGALTRRKGGVKRPPFMVDASNPVKGNAYLTSASATESAQESDRIQGSFFTHYLVSGLRGAADVTDDQRVSLNEAYQFAFNETLARTEKTQAGPQHPNYDFQLAGAGDLVLTDLRGTSATLEIDSEVSGRIFLRDRDGRLVVELRKDGGRAVQLGLEAGPYRVVLEKGREAFATDVTLRRGQTTRVKEDDLDGVDLEETVARGPARSDEENDELFEEEGGVSHVAVCFSFAPGLGTCAGNEQDVLTNLAVNIFGGYDTKLHGWGISPFFLLSTQEVHGVQISGVINATGSLRGLQVGGLFNYAYSSADAVQVSGMLNIGIGTFRGVQTAGMANVAGGNSPWLFQGSGVFNLSTADQFHGAQITGMMNFLSGEMVAGTQIAGMANANGGPFGGVQIAGMINISGPLKGLQTTNLMNIAAGSVAGAQLALVNISGDLTGAQLGLLNIAAGDVEGLQLGLVNVSGEYKSGTPFGLVNAVFGGPWHGAVWFSDLTLFNGSFEFGGDYVYTLVNVGYSPAVDRRLQRFTLELALGLRLPIPTFEELYIATDASAGRIVLWNEDQPFSFDEATSNMMSRWRIMVGYRFYEHLGVFGGFALNTVFHFRGDRDRAGLADNEISFTRYGDATARVWPGFFVGSHF